MTGLEEMFLIGGVSAAEASAAGVAAAAGIPGITAAAVTPTVGLSLGTALSAAGTLIGAASALSQGSAMNAAGKNQADVLRYQAALRGRQAEAMEQQAGQERALSQRKAAEERRMGRLAASRATSIAAASGGGALDPTIIDILSGIDTQADENAQSALYSGEERARGLEYGAVIERSHGAGNMYAASAAAQAGANAQSRSLLAAAGAVASPWRKYWPDSATGYR